MTRLTEALERVLAPETIPASPDAARRVPRPDVPTAWHFDTAVAQAPPMPVAGDADVVERPAAGDRPAFSDTTAGKLVAGEHGNAALVEQYRRLAAVLHHAQAQRQTKVVMVASAVPAEGKTLTATNLALTLSDSYQKRVLLIDADLRRPSLHTVFGIANNVGLTSALGDPHASRLPVRQISAHLWLLPAGRPDPNPMSLLTSETMKQLLADAAGQFDWVVIDTPPVGLMPDANLLAAMIDAALVVVSAGTTPYTLVKKAIEAIGPSRVLGVVLNRADKSAAAGEYDYYGYYDYESGPRPKAPRKRFALR